MEGCTHGDLTCHSSELWSCAASAVEPFKRESIYVVIYTWEKRCGMVILHV